MCLCLFSHHALGKVGLKCDWKKAVWDHQGLQSSHKYQQKYHFNRVSNGGWEVLHSIEVVPHHMKPPLIFLLKFILSSDTSQLRVHFNCMFLFKEVHRSFKRGYELLIPDTVGFL